MNELVFITLILASNFYGVGSGDKVRINCDHITLIFETREGSRLAIRDVGSFAKVTAKPADIEHMCIVAESVK